MNIFWMSIKYHVYYLLDNQSKVERCRKTQQMWPYFVFIRQSSMLVILKYVLYMAQSLLGFQIYYVWVQKQILSLSDKQISNGKILHTCMYKSLKKRERNENIIQSTLTHHLHVIYASWKPSTSWKMSLMGQFLSKLSDTRVY